MNPTMLGWVGVAVAAIGIVLLTVFWPFRTGFRMPRWQAGLVGAAFAVGAVLIGIAYYQQLALHFT